MVAALLHDIGYLILDEHKDNADFLKEDRKHEDVGAQFLKQKGFSSEIV